MGACEEGTALLISYREVVSSFLGRSLCNNKPVQPTTNDRRVAPTNHKQATCREEELLFLPHMPHVPSYRCIHATARLNQPRPQPNKKCSQTCCSEPRAQVIKSLNRAIFLHVVRSNVSTVIRVLPPATPPSCLESRQQQFPPSRYQKGPSAKLRRPAPKLEESFMFFWAEALFFSQFLTDPYQCILEKVNRMLRVCILRLMKQTHG